MKKYKTQAEIISGLNKSLEVIEIGINAYKNGKLIGWQQIVTELYKILVDIQSGPLAVLVFPNLKLHPTITIIPRLKEGDTPDLMFDPIRRHMETGKFSVEIFDEAKIKISLSEWLEQIFLVSDCHYFTIKQYLDILRHNETAHFGCKTSEILKATRMWLIVENGVTQTNVEKDMVAFGDYILKQLRDELDVLNMREYLGSTEE